MYLQPPDMSLLGMAPGDTVTAKTNLPAALKLLEDNAHKIDVPKVHLISILCWLSKNKLKIIHKIMKRITNC